MKQDKDIVEENEREDTYVENRIRNHRSTLAYKRKCKSCRSSRDARVWKMTCNKTRQDNIYVTINRQVKDKDNEEELNNG